VVIEESVTIDAGITTVWELFIDLSRWQEWNRVVTVLSAGPTGKIAEGARYTFLIPGLAFLLPLHPLAETVVPGRIIVLSGQRVGIRARHEFRIEGGEATTTVSSRETFSGVMTVLPLWPLVEMRIRTLTGALLRDLKRAAEADGIAPALSGHGRSLRKCFLKDDH
jgi:hypothetical protein